MNQLANGENKKLANDLYAVLVVGVQDHHGHHMQVICLGFFKLDPSLPG